MDDTPNLLLPYVMPSQAQKHVPVNEALRALDALVQLAVADRLSGPPAQPVEGQRFLVVAPTASAWANAVDRIAAFQDGEWSFYTPQPGWLCFVVKDNSFSVWTGSAWVGLTTTLSALQSLSRLGLNAVADATNPFSARLNRALWAARPSAESGDGNLRLVVSKEASANTASLLFQSAFSGRAEIGLAGDDDLVLKVSANGSTWLDALRLERSTGRMTVPGQIRFPATQNASSDATTLDDYREGANAPTVSAGSGTLTTASATLDFQKVGKWVTFQATITVSTAGTASGTLNVALPVAAALPGCASGVETTTGASVTGLIGGSTLAISRYDGTTVIASGRTVRVNGKYCASA